MTDDDAGCTPPDRFTETVKDALDHLYDFSKLNNHHLVQWLLPGPLPPGVSHAQALRQRLIDAIEHVDPGKRLPSAARQKRSFHLLELRYVEAMTFQEVMRTLALSQTQYHREQRHAVEMVASYLWDTLPRPSQTGRSPQLEREARVGAALEVDSASIQADFAFRHADDEIRLTPFLADVAQLVGPVVAQQRVKLRVMSTDDAVISTDRTALRNALIGTLGYLLQGDRTGEITVAVSRQDAMTCIDVHYRGDPLLDREAKTDTEQLEFSHELIQTIGGTLSVTADRQTDVLVSLMLPTTRPRVLVIDDNPGLVQLITRYLADQRYTVLSGESVEEGMSLARSVQPDVILMDVMMPRRDGWDGLQLLRHHPATARIPIIVCTILAERQLAHALGATAFIRKPLTRPALLHVLEQTLSGQPLLGVARPGESEQRVTSE